MQLLPDLKAAGIGVLPGLDRDDLNILEIGANDGTDTQEFLRAFPRGRVMCFECDPRAAELWIKLIANNPRAWLCIMALGETSGRMPFHQSGGKPPWASGKDDPDWDKSGSLLAPDRHTEFQPWLSFPGTIDVKVVSLDSISDTMLPGVIDFVWCDAQGAEAMILRGAQQMLSRIKWWYCEVHALPYYKGQATLDEIMALLPGFELYSAHEGENYLFRNTRLS